MVDVDVDEVYLIHHAHLDIGYTHDQPVAWELQRQFVDRALDLVERDRDSDDPAAFRWTVETTAPLLRWLESAPAEDVARFAALEDEGRIEVCAMLYNGTPLVGPAQVVDALRPVRDLRETYGFDVTHAMQCDVNGANWPLVDSLLDAGVEGFSMAINEYFGGAPLERPAVFEWEGPSGRTIPALNGYHYSTGISLGLHGDQDRFETVWPRAEAHLEEIGYPHSVLPVQSHHPFADNAPPHEGFATFAREWNAREDVADGDLPRVRLATPSQFWDAIGDDLKAAPTYRGDWTDFWSFGVTSSARETAINRESRRRLHTADAANAVVAAATGERPTDPATRDRAWWALHFYDEHTWGADTSTSVPDSEDVASQWNHKAHQAYEARSLSRMTRRDRVAELARRAVDEGGAGE
jgi:hypothetical protein